MTPVSQTSPRPDQAVPPVEITAEMLQAIGEESGSDEGTALIIRALRGEPPPAPTTNWRNIADIFKWLTIGAIGVSLAMRGWPASLLP